jgi:hypothetical protein
MKKPLKEMTESEVLDMITQSMKKDPSFENVSYDNDNRSSEVFFDYGGTTWVLRSKDIKKSKE